MTREMKDSGSEWIREIPKNWNVVPLKSVFSFGKGLSITKENLIESGFPVISYGQIHAKDATGTSIKDQHIRYVSEDYLRTSSSSLAKQGDIIVADTSEDLEGAGNATFVDQPTIFAGYHTVLLKNKGNADGKYIAYLMKTDQWRKQIRTAVWAVKVYSISQAVLRETSVLLPPLSEQQSIAKYLDHKTSQINALVSNIESQITKLDEYKKALITQAVTKGLDPNAEMKDSGVKWIGDMPKEWHLVPAKHLIEIKKRIAGKEGYTVLSITQSGIKPKDITSGEGQLAESYANYQFINPGEFGMNHMDLLTGWIDISNHFGVVSPDYRVFKTRHSQIDKRYLLYLYQMCYKNKIFYSLGQGAAPMGRWRLPATNMMNMKLPVPPVDEQKNIADFLDHQCNLIDRSIGDLRTQLTLLGSYKKSLIFDYVTGKKEVPADFRKEQSYEK